MLLAARSLLQITRVRALVSRFLAVAGVVVVTAWSVVGTPEPADANNLGAFIFNLPCILQGLWYWLLNSLGSLVGYNPGYPGYSLCSWNFGQPVS